MAYNKKSTITSGPSAQDNDKACEIFKKAHKAFNCSERQNIESTWKLLAEFILPNANGGFFGDETKGIRRDRRVYDSTGQQACRDLASFIHSTVTNPAMQWSQLKFRNDALNSSNKAVEWMQGASDKVHIALNECNFNAEVGEGYLSLCGLGTTVIFHEELENDTSGKKFNFQTWHLSEVAYAENAMGMVDTIYRKFKLTLKVMYERFGDAIGPDLMDKLDQSPLEEYHLYHAIYPRDASEIKIDPKTGLALPQNRPYASCYVLQKGSRLLKEDGYYEFPVYVPRWSTLPAEIYGYGPGHTSISDVRSMNKIWEESLKALAKSVNPTILATKMNMLSADLRPGKIIPVRDVNQIKEFVTQSRMDMLEFVLNKKETIVKAAFYIDKLILPPRTETGAMTAYEVAQRLEQLQQIMGPVVSRFNDELLQPLIVRSMNILMRSGDITPFPQDVLALLPVGKNGTKALDFEVLFINSLARSQQLAELQNVQQFVQECGGIAQMNPQVLDIINFDEVALYSAKIRQIPEKMLNDPKDVAAQRQQRQQQQAQQQALAAGEQVGNIAGKIGPLMQQQQGQGGGGQPPSGGQ